MYPELQPAPPLSSGVTVDKLITLAGPMCEMEKELHLHIATTQQTSAIIIIINYFLPLVQLLPTRWFFPQHPPHKSSPHRNSFLLHSFICVTVFHVAKLQFWCSLAFLQPPYFTSEFWFFPGEGFFFFRSICSCLLVILLFLCGDKDQGLLAYHFADISLLYLFYITVC